MTSGILPKGTLRGGVDKGLLIMVLKHSPHFPQQITVCLSCLLDYN